MGKARGKGRGSGRSGDGSCRGRGRGQGENVPQPTATSSRSHFLTELLGKHRTTPVLRTDQCEQVINWIADNTSSYLGTTTSGLSSTRSTLSSRESRPHTPPHPDAPSSHHAECRQTASDPTLGHSEELFTGPFPYLGPSPDTLEVVEEEIPCCDAQIFEQPRPQEVDVGNLSQEVDDDETQLPGSEEEDRGAQVEEEEVVDDLVTDPTWKEDMQSEASSTQGEGGRVPQQAGRSSVVAADRRQATVPRNTNTRDVASTSGRSSRVWNFFKDSADNPKKAICSTCHASISRGDKTTSLTTTSMIRHMAAKHPTLWGETQGPRPVSAGVTTASSAVVRVREPPVVRARQSPVHTACKDAPSSQSSLVMAVSQETASTSTSTSHRSVQLSISQTFERKRKFAANAPQATVLNSHISRLLALEMLPFRLVETESFRNLMAVAVPRYSVPSRHYFARCAIPALHKHVSQSICRALNNAVTGRVHLTTDTWTSACGQGRYISLTAHWVNIVEAGTQSDLGTEHILPTPRIAGPMSVRVAPTVYSSCASSSSSSSCSASISDITTSVTSWKHCSTASAKRQQAVLKLISLGDKPHTACELWTAVKEQADLWLRPLNLHPGMVVCDNGRNLVAALRRGEITHVPCLAHVLNLVVQRFLKSYPELPDLLVKVRRLSAHFRKSATASAALAVLQQRLQLPAHRLVCDVPTRWNSTLHMLQRICEQKRAVVEYQLQQGRRYSGQTPHIRPQEWTWMSDICTILTNFEESTKMVSGDDAIISVSIPLVCLLQRSLQRIKEEALQPEYDEMDQEAVAGDYTQPSLISSQRALGDNEGEEEEEEEEEQELLSCVVDGSTCTSVIPSVQRGWPEDRGEEEEEEESMVSRHLGEDTEILPVTSLARMADFMLRCLNRDPRVVKMLGDSHYWLVTLLDPRYKENFHSLIPEVERSTKMGQYQKALAAELLKKFPSEHASGRGHSSLTN